MGAVAVVPMAVVGSAWSALRGPRAQAGVLQPPPSLHVGHAAFPKLAVLRLPPP